MAAERRSELLRSPTSLRETDRVVISCRYPLELSEEETAATLDCARGTVKSRLSRALGRLRALMKEEKDAGYGTLPRTRAGTGTERARVPDRISSHAGPRAIGARPDRSRGPASSRLVRPVPPRAVLGGSGGAPAGPRHPDRLPRRPRHALRFTAGQGPDARDAAQSGITRPAGNAAEPSPTTTETEGEAPSTSGETSAAPESAGPIRPGGGGIEASGPSFSTFDQMVATSHLVVIGTVTEVLPGRVIQEETMGPEESYPDPIGNEGTVPPPPPPEEVAEPGAFPTRFPVTVVRVDEVLKGQGPETETLNVETLELAYGGPRNPEWRQPGKRVLLSLSHGGGRDGRDIYVMAGPSFEEMAYIIRDQDLVATLRSPLSNLGARCSPVPEHRTSRADLRPSRLGLP